MITNDKNKPVVPPEQPGKSLIDEKAEGYVRHPGIEQLPSVEDDQEAMEEMEKEEDEKAS